MSDALDVHRTFIEGLTAALLEPYVSALPTEPAQRPHAAPKEFNDPVWGTLIVQPFEISLIDSPLIQRLRQIRQLGVVHLVYPSALHTRYEHVLGAAHLTESLIGSINSHSDLPVVPHALAHTVKLAALCHDVGHGVMSHVSENAVKGTPGCARIVTEFCDSVVRFDGVSLSELNAYYMVGSPACRALFDRLRLLYPAYEVVDDLATMIQGAIVGSRIWNEIPLLQELISGAFDVDKLDYMKRDAHMSGVPVVTDVGRLVQKVRSVPVALADLPQELADRVDSGPSHFHITGIAFSGARTLDELMLGRILLFDKIYRHQKVRACEAMVAALLRGIADASAVAASELMMRLNDDDVFRLTKERIAELSGGAEWESEDRRAKAGRFALSLSRDLRDRRLWTRAYAFARNMPFDAYRWDSEHSMGLQQFQNEVRARPRVLASAIADETLRVVDLLGDALPEQVVTEHLVDYIHIDAPMTPPEPDDSAYLITPNDKLIRFDDEYAETRDWVKAYHLTRDVGFVFSPPEITGYVFAAVESLARRKFGIRTPRIASEYSRLDAEQIRDIKRRLADAGYYADVPFDIRPEPELFRRGSTPGRIENIVRKLEGYCGPVKPADSTNKATLLHKDRVLAWLHQFDSEDLVTDALTILEAMKHVDRPSVVAGLASFLEESGDRYAGAALVPLGEPKDSSAIMTYYANDLARDRRLMTADIEHLPVERPLVFVDDFIGSGQQATSIVEAWLGEEPTTNLNEERVELAPGSQELLRKAPQLAFVFVAGTEEGRDAFKARLDRLGLNAEVHVCETTIPRLSDLSLGHGFDDHARDIGESLLAAHHDAEWAGKRALGYGNGGYLVVFSHNTPTQTLTCLWEEGEYEGVPWMPLFPRRKKH